VATVITALDGPTAYLALIDRIRRVGVHRSPRGEETRDLGYTVLEIEDPTRATPLGVGRGVSRNIIAAEAVQLVGAFSDPGLLPGASFAPYRERDGRFWGAYGDRIGYQLLDVVHKLKTDASTRRAVISLWDPRLDNVDYKNDYPCTVMLQFEHDDDGRLCLNVIMRSNDAWLGTPYDLAQFSVLLQTAATLVGRPVGWYRHTALSLHLYERDVIKTFEKLHTEPEEVAGDSFPRGLARPGDTALQAIQRIRKLPYVDGHYLVQEHWYREALKPAVVG